VPSRDAVLSDLVGHDGAGDALWRRLGLSAEVLSTSVVVTPHLRAGWARPAGARRSPAGCASKGARRLPDWCRAGAVEERRGERSRTGRARGRAAQAVDGVPVPALERHAELSRTVEEHAFRYYVLARRRSPTPSTTPCCSSCAA
jgi:hypothetical protein